MALLSRWFSELPQVGYVILPWRVFFWYTYTLSSEPRSNKLHWLSNHRLSMLRTLKERCVQGGPLLAINWSYNLCKCSMNGLLWLSHPYINWVCFTLLITGRGDLVFVFLYPWMIFREWSHCNHHSPMEKLLRFFLLVPFSSVEHDRYIYLCTWMYDLYSKSR